MTGEANRAAALMIHVSYESNGRICCSARFKTLEDALIPECRPSVLILYSTQFSNSSTDNAFLVLGQR